MNTFIYTDQKLNATTTCIITFLFFLVSFIGIYFHEIWMDESHHFLLARDSNSLLDLYANTRYDGHPILWNCLVHIVTLFSRNPIYMQLLHISISSLIAYLFLKKGPFKLWFKIAFLLSYFMLYEYTVISRNYNLGVLFLFLSCSFYAKRKEYFTTFCLFLALCCNTHAIFTIVSSTLLLSVFLEQISNNTKEKITQYWKGYLVFIIGISIAYYQIIPPSDTTFFEKIDYSDFYQTIKSGMSLFKALFPIVDFTSINYWNHFYFIEHFKIISMIIGLLIWFIPLALFNKNKNVLFFVYSTFICFISFVLVTQRHGTRYNGLLFITIIVALWMLFSQKEKPLLKKKISKFNTTIIIFIMSIQVVAGLTAYNLGIKKTFNNGEKVASYITEKKLDLNTIVTACESASINAFLKDNLYNLWYQKSQGYYLWNKEYVSFFNKSKEEIISLGFEKKPTKKALYYILNEQLKFGNRFVFNNKTYSLSLIKKFDGAVKHNYYIYLIKCNE